VEKEGPQNPESRNCQLDPKMKKAKKKKTFIRRKKRGKKPEGEARKQAETQYLRALPKGRDKARRGGGNEEKPLKVEDLLVINWRMASS